LVGDEAQPTMVKATVAEKMAVATRLVMFMVNSFIVDDGAAGYARLSRSGWFR
jgi:hypothetical protein